MAKDKANCDDVASIRTCLAMTAGLWVFGSWCVGVSNRADAHGLGRDAAVTALVGLSAYGAGIYYGATMYKSLRAISRRSGSE